MVISTPRRIALLEQAKEERVGILRLYIDQPPVAVVVLVPHTFLGSTYRFRFEHVPQNLQRIPLLLHEGGICLPAQLHGPECDAGSLGGLCHHPDLIQDFAVGRGPIDDAAPPLAAQGGALQLPTLEKANHYGVGILRSVLRRTLPGFLIPACPVG